MNKNTQVATAKEGKTPTGKIKTLAARNARRAAAEQEYINFRVNALKRRCKRMGTSEEETKKLVEQLMTDIKAPKKYSIHILFRSGQEMKPSDKMKPIYERIDGKTVKVGEKKQRMTGTAFSTLATEAIKNSKIEYKILTPAWALIEGGKEVLDKLREILAGWATIHPYEIKPKPPKPKSEKKPSNNTPEAKKAAKERRKFANVSHNTNRVKRSKATAFTAKRERLAKAKKDRKANIIHLQKNKRSTASKKASTGLKKAA